MTERLEHAAERIRAWAEAYPLDVFPEPDWTAVHEALHAAGISVASVSASNFRFVLKRVRAMLEDTL